MALNITNAQRAEVLTQALPYIQKYYNKVNKPNSEITGITPITEEYCIKFLKDRGYRVLKKVTEFKEI